MTYSAGTAPAPTLTSLHDLVVDYVSTQAYSSTAKILARHLPLSTSSTAGPSGSGSSTIRIETTAIGDDGGDDGESMDLDDDGDDGSQVVSAKKAAKRPARADGIVLDAQTLALIEQRRAIIDNILNGSITTAVQAINAHFPHVLAPPPPLNESTNGNDTPAPGRYTNGHSSSSHIHGNGYGNGYSRHNPPSFPSSLMAEHSIPVFNRTYSPAHVRLNLQIQEFIESVRLIAPSSSTPSSPSSSIGSLTSVNPLTNSAANLQTALSAAQDLHKEAKKFPPDDRAIYLQEIKDVGALFAYTDPETSVLKGFLDQGRRIALAEQVNAAILKSEGKPVQSRLEAFVRRTTAMYNIMSEHGIDPRPPWTAADGQGKEQLAAYWKDHSGKPFSLTEYVAETW